MSALQGSLFDSDTAPTLRPLGAGLTRTQLDPRAGSTTGWLGRRLRLALRRGGRGRAVARREAADVRPRRRRAAAGLLVRRRRRAAAPGAPEARFRLSAFYRDVLPEGFATAGLCLYRDGRDSVAWHGDTIGRGRTEDTLVAIVSLGAPRALLLRPAAVGRPHASCSATATCWSWGARASASGSTRSRRAPGRVARGSRSSSARRACGRRRRLTPRLRRTECHPWNSGCLRARRSSWSAAASLAPASRTT